MPYVSDKQRKFFHTKTAKKKGITSAMVKEFDKASKGKKLPKSKKTKTLPTTGDNKKAPMMKYSRVTKKKLTT